METVRPEDFKPENSPWFFDALHSYAVGYANTNFRFDVSLSHGLKDIMPIDSARKVIREGTEAGDLILIEGGERETLYALLRSEEKLFVLQIPRTFPEIEEGYKAVALSGFAIDIVTSGGDNSKPEIRVSGKRIGGKRRDNPEVISIIPGRQTFGVLRAPFPPLRSVSYLRSR